MSTASLFVKTPKGIEEVASRVHGLPQRSRRLLIMVDGKRDVAALAAMCPNEDVPATLAALEAEGFLAPLAVAAPPAKVTAAAPEDDAKRFDMAKNFMINTTRVFLGVMGSGLMEKLEACNNLEDLRGRYSSWREAIALTPDGRKEIQGLESRLAALLS